MPKSTVPWLSLLLLPLVPLASLLACATPSPPVEQRPTVLLLPPNFDTTIPDRLIEGLDLVAVAVVREVHEEGSLRCEPLDPATVLKLWPLALEEVGGLTG